MTPFSRLGPRYGNTRSLTAANRSSVSELELSEKVLQYEQMDE